MTGVHVAHSYSRREPRLTLEPFNFIRTQIFPNSRITLYFFIFYFYPTFYFQFLFQQMCFIFLRSMCVFNKVLYFNFQFYLADKRKDDYASVANYIRTKIRFALLKSVLLSLRGVRGKQQKEDSMMATSAVAFGLIPERVSYEAY